MRTCSDSSKLRADSELEFTSPYLAFIRLVTLTLAHATRTMDCHVMNRVGQVMSGPGGQRQEVQVVIMTVTLIRAMQVRYCTQKVRGLESWRKPFGVTPDAVSCVASRPL